MARSYVRATALLGLLVASLITFLELSERQASAVKRFLYDEEHPTRTLNVATVAMEIDRDPAANRRKLASLVREIVYKRPDVELIAFGETILGWFYPPPDAKRYQQQVSEPIPGPTTKLLSGLASEHGVSVTFGMSELRGEELFNSQVLIDRQGRIVAVQRKKNLKSSAFSPGDSPVAFVEIEGIRLALVICFDMRSGETERLVREHGPDLLVLSNADMSEPWDGERFGMRYVAKSLRTWIVSANRFGQEGDIYWDGHTEIVSPLGDLRASGSGGEHFLYYEVGFDQEPGPMRAKLRGVYSTVSLPYFIVRNLHTAFGYATNGKPLRAWAMVGAVAILSSLLVTMLLRRRA